MAKYKVLNESFINGRLVSPGTVVDFKGVPGSNLEPMDADAKAAKKVAGNKPDVTDGADLAQQMAKTDAGAAQAPA